jgi:DNA-directed RNA polymerase specialized sigma24 family protein
MVLFGYEKHTAAEIGAILGISEANVYATLHVARNRLRLALQPYFAES